MGFALDMAREAGRQVQIGAPTLPVSMESYLARPEIRSEHHRLTLQGQFEKHLKDWMRLPLDEISKAMPTGAPLRRWLLARRS